MVKNQCRPSRTWAVVLAIRIRQFCGDIILIYAAGSGCEAGQPLPRTELIWRGQQPLRLKRFRCRLCACSADVSTSQHGTWACTFPLWRGGSSRGTAGPFRPRPRNDVHRCYVAFRTLPQNFIGKVCTLRLKESWSAFLRDRVATGKPLASQFARHTRHSAYEGRKDYYDQCKSPGHQAERLYFARRKSMSSPTQ